MCGYGQELPLLQSPELLKSKQKYPPLRPRLPDEPLALGTLDVNKLTKLTRILLPCLGSFLVLPEPADDARRPPAGAADTVLSLAEAAEVNVAGCGSLLPLSADGLLPSAGIVLALSLAAARKSQLKCSVTYDRCEVAVLETAVAAASEPLLPATGRTVCLFRLLLPAALLDEAGTDPAPDVEPAVVEPSGAY